MFHYIKVEHVPNHLHELLVIRAEVLHPSFFVTSKQDSRWLHIQVLHGNQQEVLHFDIQEVTKLGVEVEIFVGLDVESHVSVKTNTHYVVSSYLTPLSPFSKIEVKRLLVLRGLEIDYVQAVQDLLQVLADEVDALRTGFRTGVLLESVDKLLDLLHFLV